VRVAGPICWLVLMLSLGGCRPQGTEIIVVIDQAVPADEEISDVDISVWSERALPTSTRVPIGDLPHVQVLTPLYGDEGEVSIAVAGWSEFGATSGPVRHVRTRFVPNEFRLLHITLVRCSPGCRVGHTCTEQGCAPIDVDPESLEVYSELPTEPAVLGCGVMGSMADLCDGRDDDCDGVLDEGGEMDSPIDSNTDPLNCGRCGHTCATSCTAGLCDDERASALASGPGHVCATRLDGVICWGWNEFGQLASDDLYASQATVPELAPPTSMALGVGHTCAATEAGVVSCWGDSLSGQTGLLDAGFHSSPTAVEGLPTITSVVAGAAHSCALTDDGSVFCWGGNGRGQLGRMDVGEPSRLARSVAGLSGVTSIAAGAFHTCAIAGGTVSCWGAGDDGQLGPGSAADASAPVEVVGIAGAVSLAAGLRHTCARLETGGVACWGDDRRGQLGRGSFGSDPAPDAVVDLDGVAALSAAVTGEHTCALLAPSGRIRCWGAGLGAQLGDGMTENRASPVQVPGLEGMTALAAGGDARGSGHTCAIDPGGRILCWGDNGLRQLGRSGGRGTDPAPVELR